MLHILSVWIGKILLTAARLRGGGSALPGMVVEKLNSTFLQQCTSSFDEVVLVAGTNGKTTTTKMIRHILQDANHHVLTNAAGSNMPRGIISALLSAMNWRGQFHADVALFEVDEGFIAEVAAALNPRVVVVLNLLRDQLDRYGELDRTARLIGDALPSAEYAVLNGDDPRVANLRDTAKQTLFFGADAQIRERIPHDDALYGSHEQAIPTQQNDIEIVSARDTDSGQEILIRRDKKTHTVTLQMPGVFNAYNAIAALSATQVLGVKPDQAAKSLRQVPPAFGRSERIKVGDKHVLLLLVKNPSGFNQILHTYLQDDSQEPVLIAINDNYADGRDVSWLWDVDIEQLSAGGHRFLTTGTRAYDMALRLQYADIASQPEIANDAALDLLIEQTEPAQTAYIITTYTAMLDLRKQLGKYAELGRIEI